jgi:hypothetical protein
VEKYILKEPRAKFMNEKYAEQTLHPASSGSRGEKVISIISDDVFASSFSLRVNEHPMQHGDLHFN